MCYNVLLLCSTGSSTSKGRHARNHPRRSIWCCGRSPSQPCGFVTDSGQLKEWVQMAASCRPHVQAVSRQLDAARQAGGELYRIAEGHAFLFSGRGHRHLVRPPSKFQIITTAQKNSSRNNHDIWTTRRSLGPAWSPKAYEGLGLIGHLQPAAWVLHEDCDNCRLQSSHDTLPPPPPPGLMWASPRTPTSNNLFDDAETKQHRSTYPRHSLSILASSS